MHIHIDTMPPDKGHIYATHIQSQWNTVIRIHVHLYTVYICVYANNFCDMPTQYQCLTQKYQRLVGYLDSQILIAKAPHFYRALLLKSLSNFRSSQPDATSYNAYTLVVRRHVKVSRSTGSYFVDLLSQFLRIVFWLTFTWIRSYAEAF